jgi:hypothetical protein
VNVFDEIASLFHAPKSEIPKVAYPETAQDGGEPVVPPNSDPKYFKPAYPGMVPVGILPTTEHPDAHWLEATKQGKFIPFLGEEPHGEEINIDPNMIPVHDVDLTKARGVGYGTPIGQPHAVPVPVTVVNAPVLFGIENRFSANSLLLTANTPALLSSRRPDRVRAQILVSAVGPVIINATKEDVGSGIGFVVPIGVAVTINTNQPIWVMSTVGSTAVSVVEEYTVVEGSKRI